MQRALLPLARLLATNPPLAPQGCVAALSSLLPFQELLQQRHQWTHSTVPHAPSLPAAAHPPARWERHAAQLQQRRTLAGPADFDLISVEVGLARIDGYDETGFIVSDMQVEGPILCYGDLVTLWRVGSFQELSMQSLALVDLVKPAPALLVVGCGRAIRPLPADLLGALWQRGISVEALDTVNAVSTFNLLNQEGRKVVGAMLPLGMS